MSKQTEINTRERVDNAMYQKIPIEQIRPNPNQPRRFFDQDALRALSESIIKMGLLEDILVRPAGDGYEIVLGERRWRATTMAGLQTINAKIVELTDEEMNGIAIVENIQREDLSKVEEAFAFKHYLDKGYKQKEIGMLLGKMEDRVTDHLKILNSSYFIKYQEEKIDELTYQNAMLEEKLKKQSQSSRETKMIGEQDLVVYLNEGFDLITRLDNNYFLVRK